jgi:hypothetical protein
MMSRCSSKEDSSEGEFLRFGLACKNKRDIVRIALLRGGEACGSKNLSHARMVATIRFRVTHGMLSILFLDRVKFVNVTEGFATQSRART